MKRTCALYLLTATLCLWPLNVSRAAGIQYTATNLADLVMGEDLWQYTYTVNGFDFDTNFGFSIFFDLTLYSALEDPPPAVHADWNVRTFQPDPGIPADGLYDALALTDNASLADPFTVRFVWLGGPGTIPGSQPFEINQFDDVGDCLVCPVTTGRTTPVAGVPEPGTFALLLTGIAGLWASVWRWQRHGVAQSRH